jgi:hypothetical protein
MGRNGPTQRPSRNVRRGIREARNGEKGSTIRLSLPVVALSADLGPQAELVEHLHGEGEGALLVVEADERAALPR